MSVSLAALAVLLGTSVRVGASVEDPIPAVWKERKLSFSYASSIALYTCDALEDRVSALLRAVGARDDIKVRASSCSDTFSPMDPGTIGPGGWNGSRAPADRNYQPTSGTSRRQSAVVYVTLRMPVEVTPEVRAELEKDKEKRELIARVTGNPAARFNDPVMFAAARQQVTLSRKTVGLEPEECELVDQMSLTVFRELGVDIVRRSAPCDRMQVSRISPELVVESLMPAQFEPPGQGDDEDVEAAEPEKRPVPAPPTTTPVVPEDTKGTPDR